MTDNTYNGWANYETWQAALHLSEYDYAGLQEDIAEDHGDNYELDADDVRVFIEEIVLDGVDNIEGLQSDIIQAWLREVDFDELAERFEAEVTEQ